MWFVHGFTAMQLALAVWIVVERDAVFPPGWPLAFALLAVLPWVLQTFWVLLPAPVFAACVMAGVAGLVQRPTDVDLSPFFLVSMAAELGSVVAVPVSGAVAAAAAALMIGVELSPVYDGALPWIIGIGVGWLAGITMRSQMRTTEQLRAAQDDLARRAADEERARIAREIHDVIAHSLTVTMLHVTGARLALRGDPERAEEALLEAERAGRRSLSEIRRTVGLLSPHSGDTHALPTATDVPSLVAGVRDAGLEVTLEVAGDLTGIAPGPGLALYRIAQESLANVIKHAPGAAARVRVDVSRCHVNLRIENPAGQTPTAEDGGHGLSGMRERAEALGGSFEAGRHDGRWLVDARLPREVE